MKTGIKFYNTDETYPPLDFARLVEDNGIESIWLPDHSHVPAQSRVREEDKVAYGGTASGAQQRKFDTSPVPGGPPREYYRNYDPVTTLAMMGAVTSTLKLGTGICLVVQRDPIILAKEIATIDRLTEGRFLFGVGAGAPWNLAELENHGVNPKRRTGLMLERLEAMKQIWVNEQAEYHGKQVDFDPIYQWPKPFQQPHPPILMGGMGPTVLDRALTHADGWIPGHSDDTFDGLGDRVTELRERAAAVGKTMEITLNLGRLDYLDRYVEMGLDRVVYMVSAAASESETRKFVRELGKVAEEVKGAVSPQS
ncbi:LLM class F420-dependent oxidoreductase [Arthrobacter sp. OV608]|uniref:LLM class F420-dependent oxidoreductase n=1 Tax=Arthrobacter sp. OV608 TaxID=1882768 RepID=UPI0008B10B7C|nr:LLM class F420-dependent oxidoreductase [Arthrobacter sp. OV608]SER33575.1 probable F420-dependent oxidoreductase, Rv2161c family [Arthrobacter sp. OV608]